MVGMTGPHVLLEVRNMSLRFGDLIAIDNLDLTIDKGQILALVGPNGAGKTAALNCINGVYRPQSGEILLESKNITTTPLHQIAANGIGRSFQHVELFPHMNVLDNLLLGRHRKMRTGIIDGGLYFGWARREENRHRATVEEVIDFFELSRYRDHAAGTLPYGIQKLVGVARALAMEPKILLLDEPSTGLVREEKENLARFLMRIKYDLGLTILWVEHDMQLVGDLADYMVVLNYGVKIAEGSPSEVRRNEEVIKAYLGSNAAIKPKEGSS